MRVPTPSDSVIERLRALGDRPATTLDGRFPRGNSAVLVLIVDGPEPGLVLTRRASHLSTDPGFVALPGGRVEPGEAAEHTACRETEEEVGVKAAKITVHGRLDDTWNGAGFRIIPIVGSIAGPVHLRPEAGEVTAAAVLALHQVVAPTHHRVVTKTIDGHDFLDDVITVPDPLASGDEPASWELYGPTADIMRDVAAWMVGDDRLSIPRRQADLDHFAAHRWV